MKTLESSHIINFAMSCIANAMPTNEIHPDMQIFKECFDMPLKTKDFNRKWHNKFRREWKRHIYDLGYMAIYGEKSSRNNITSLSGAIEQIGRTPRNNDKFYFEYLVSGTNYKKRFLSVLEWNELSNFDGDVVPMRRAQILSEVCLRK